MAHTIARRTPRGVVREVGMKTVGASHASHRLPEFSPNAGQASTNHVNQRSDQVTDRQMSSHPAPVVVIRTSGDGDRSTVDAGLAFLNAGVLAGRHHQSAAATTLRNVPGSNNFPVGWRCAAGRTSRSSVLHGLEHGEYIGGAGRRVHEGKPQHDPAPVPRWEAEDGACQRLGP